MKPILLLRKVIGDSMAPKLKQGQHIVATGLFRRLHPGDVVILEHGGKQKVKRIERIEDGKLFVIGDNLAASTDSRQFGWLDQGKVAAKVIWPQLSK